MGGDTKGALVPIRDVLRAKAIRLVSTKRANKYKNFFAIAKSSWQKTLRMSRIVCTKRDLNPQPTVPKTGALSS